MVKMVKTKQEKVILVNKQNKKIGVEEKIKAHKLGKLHRAFSILVFNSKGETLLQQRTKTKYHSGELWSNTCCSHPKPNETYLQATHRRLNQEMGFDCKLKKTFCFIYNTGFKNNLIENEYDCVFLGKYEGKIKANPKEVKNYKWESLKKLKQDIKKNPEKYSVWLKIILKKLKNSQIKKIIK
jgi:isopentenyl-diphosphate delta-isomerase